MQITNQITKDFVRQFRDIWNNGSALERMNKVQRDAENDYYKVTFGSFIPPFSSGIDARKSFYSSVGFPVTADEIEALNKRYLGVIKIDGC